MCISSIFLELPASLFRHIHVSFCILFCYIAYLTKRSDPLCRWEKAGSLTGKVAHPPTSRFLCPCSVPVPQGPSLQSCPSLFLARPRPYPAILCLMPCTLPRLSLPCSAFSAFSHCFHCCLLIGLRVWIWP
ncbi:hypothetical protein BDP81DRAFT_176146 [Colletotrichum phormii]|uniref:Uncharacterized protein n=1 Tax=Colletotrichum phormii TaxID=359342 RepID=A0AAJ0EGI5_9PEZI|nr:uncharacterized protein BDP81DRAFT_176146 [Colletotrichum phormii]KAK1639367.1 hypothetical protein BDP81DRAFT_176146 [Colletotrichum phormii]